VGRVRRQNKYNRDAKAQERALGKSHAFVADKFARFCSVEGVDSHVYVPPETVGEDVL
jgi:hypothetical protein